MSNRNDRRNHSRNIPYVLDFFLVVDGMTSARAGRTLDGLLHTGGFTVFFRNHRLEVDIHAVGAVLRWWRSHSPSVAA